MRQSAERTRATPGLWLKAIRVHQWPKNLLIFLPLLLAQQETDGARLLVLVAAFLLFSLAASATYLINDLLDLEADRQHPSKRHRPLASGAMSLRQGRIAAAGLLMAALAGAALLSPLFVALMMGYLVLTLAYSLWLKRRPVVDVLILGGLYSYRVVIGGLVVNIDLSFWLLAFAMFFFLGLACVKRSVDLAALVDSADPVDLAETAGDRMAGRGYLAADAGIVQTFGVVASYLSVLVMALYVHAPEVRTMYLHPGLLWPVCLALLYWVTRIWFLAHRGQVDADPVLFALRDRTSWVLLAAITALLFVANRGREALAWL